MKTRYFLPSGYLAGIVKYYQITEVPEGSGNMPGINILPSGYPELIFAIGSASPKNRRTENKKPPSSFIVGQISKSVELNLNGFLKFLCVKLNPTSLHAIFGIGSNYFTDKLTDLSVFENEKSFLLPDELAAAADDAEKINVIESFLGQKLKKDVKTCRHIQSCVEKIVKSGGKMDYNLLTYNSGFSQSTLQR
ncbi:MAG: DUF6597 domain-containing transcriptional factor, partial [Prolixibacteraceae bacterium]